MYALSMKFNCCNWLIIPADTPLFMESKNKYIIRIRLVRRVMAVIDIVILGVYLKISLKTCNNSERLLLEG